jgi:hypothetical protein
VLFRKRSVSKGHGVFSKPSSGSVSNRKAHDQCSTTAGLDEKRGRGVAGERRGEERRGRGGEEGRGGERREELCVAEYFHFNFTLTLTLTLTLSHSLSLSLSSFIPCSPKG